MTVGTPSQTARRSPLVRVSVCVCVNLLPGELILLHCQYCTNIDEESKTTQKNMKKKTTRKRASHRPCKKLHDE